MLLSPPRCLAPPQKTRPILQLGVSPTCELPRQTYLREACSRVLRPSREIQRLQGLFCRPPDPKTRSAGVGEAHVQRDGGRRPHRTGSPRRGRTGGWRGGMSNGRDPKGRPGSVVGASRPPGAGGRGGPAGGEAAPDPRGRDGCPPWGYRWGWGRLGGGVQGGHQGGGGRGTPVAPTRRPGVGGGPERPEGADSMWPPSRGRRSPAKPASRSPARGGHVLFGVRLGGASRPGATTRVPGTPARGFGGDRRPER